MGLNKLSRHIQQGLLSRPETNQPKRDFSEVLAKFEEQAQPVITGLVEAFQNFGVQVAGSRYGVSGKRGLAGNGRTCPST